MLSSANFSKLELCNKIKLFLNQSKIKWKTIPRFWGDKGIDTVLTLNVSQLVFN